VDSSKSNCLVKSAKLQEWTGISANVKKLCRNCIFALTRGMSVHVRFVTKCYATDRWLGMRIYNPRA